MSAANTKAQTSDEAGRWLGIITYLLTNSFFTKWFSLQYQA